MRQPAHGGNLAWAAATAGCSPGAIVDFSASISPLGPPYSILSAIELQLGNIRHYPDPNYIELRNALSLYHNLSPEWILPGNGSAELLTLAGRDLAEFAATVLVTPAFGDYFRSLNAYDAKVLEFPLCVSRQLSSVGCVLSGILDKSQLNGNNGIIINNPHNPTGVLFSREDILPLLKDFALVVVDEAFMDFLPPQQEQSLISLVQDYPNLVVLRSLTKFYSLPGLRIGYAIANPERLRRWGCWRDPWSVNTLAEVAAIAALRDKEFQAKTWAWLPPAREKLFWGLSQIKGLRPFEGAANFLLVESEESVLRLQEKLLKQHRLLIRDCLSFPQLGDRFFRVAVRSESDNQRLIDALVDC
jgi:L-threonine-O-3-phosphate decarboxylase